MDAIGIKTALPLIFAAGICAYIEGPPGAGKTQIGEQYADEQHTPESPYALLELNAATANLADVMGFFMPEKRTYKLRDGSEMEVKHGRNTFPYYFMDRRTGMPAFMFERGLLIIEEYGQGVGDVKRALASLMYGKRMGEFQLPMGFDILILSNRPEDRSGVSKDFDFLINRRVTLKYEPTLNPLMDHFDKIGVHHLVKSFLKVHPEVVLNSKVPEKQGPWFTPRTAEFLSNIFHACERMDRPLNGPGMLEIMAGLVGAGGAAQVSAHVKLHMQLPSPEDVKRDPLKAKVPDAPDALMIVTYMLAQHATHKDIANVVTYMRRCPSAYGVAFMKALIRRDDTFFTHQSVGDWIAANTDILAALADKVKR